jgi:hypothetical protein
MTRAMNNDRPAGALLAAVLLLLTHADGIAAQTVTPALRACRAETDGAKRLACFDREMARIDEVGQAPAAAAAPTAASKSPAPPSPVERFGLPPEHSVDDLPKKLTSQITGVSQQSHGRYLITLANGEVWLQTEDNLGFSPKAGGSVTVKRGLTGGYYMADQYYVVAVRRVQ